MKSFPLLAFLALVACNRPAPAPQLSSVTPAQVSAFTASDLILRGEGIGYALKADLDRPSESTFTLGLQVKLIGAQTFTLAAQRVTSATVTAQVPAGVPVGRYTVELSTALGVARLTDGIEV